MIKIIDVFQPPFVYFIIFGMIIGIVVSLIRARQDKDEVKRYEGQTLNEVIEGENIKPYVRNLGRITKKGKLITPFKTIDIKRSVIAELKYTKISNPSNSKVESKNKFCIFESGKSILADIPILNKITGKPEYYIIDNNEDYLVKDVHRDTWVLKPNVFLYQLGGIWLSSDEGREFITEFVYKKIYENLKEEDMNYPKRIVWYNDVYASNMTSEEQKYDLEKKKWEDRIKGEVAS